MSQPFKTQREIFEHLLKGGEVKHALNDSIIYLKENGEISEPIAFTNPSDWAPYTEPKPKKKVYEYMWKDSSGRWYMASGLFESDKDAKNFYASAIRTGREFEVDDE